MLPLGFDDSNFAYNPFEILTSVVFPIAFETEGFVWKESNPLDELVNFVDVELFKKNTLFYVLEITL